MTNAINRSHLELYINEVFDNIEILEYRLHILRINRLYILRINKQHI